MEEVLPLDYFNRKYENTVEWWYDNYGGFDPEVCQLFGLVSNGTLCQEDLQELRNQIEDRQQALMEAFEKGGCAVCEGETIDFNKVDYLSPKKIYSLLLNEQPVADRDLSQQQVCDTEAQQPERELYDADHLS